MKTVNEFLIDGMGERYSKHLKTFLEYMKDINYNDGNHKLTKEITDKYFESMTNIDREIFRILLANEFNTPYKLSDHFIMRLIIRFGNNSVDFIMNDINRIWKNRSNKSKRKGVLIGDFYKIIYNNNDNTLITITSFNDYQLSFHRAKKSYRKRHVLLWKPMTLSH